MFKKHKKNPQAAPTTELVHPGADGFVDRVTPKKPDDKLFLFACSCGGSHFRHAGYVKSMLPFLRPGGERRVAMDSIQVMVCVACRRSHVWIDEQMYDVTDKIDLTAWEKTEKELNKATGPGGEC